MLRPSLALLASLSLLAAPLLAQQPEAAPKPAANDAVGSKAPPKSGAVRIAAAQPRNRTIDWEIDDPAQVLRRLDQSLEELEQLIDKAGQAGCDAIAFPEDTLGLLKWEAAHPDELAQVLPEAVSRMLARLGRAAARHRLYLVVCNDALEADGRARNTAFLIGRDGREIGRYHKVNLPLPEQSRTRGDRFPVFPTPDLGGVGMLICYDMVFPESTRCLALAGADVIFVPTLGGAAIGDEDISRAAFRTRAVDNFVWLVVAMRGRGSMIISPQGKVVAEAKEADGLAIADIDPLGEREGGDAFNQQRDMRGRLFRERVPDAYKILTDPHPPVLAKVQSNVTPEEATRIFATALTSGERRFNEAEALAKAGKTEEAIALFEKLCRECRTSWIDREGRERIARLRAGTSRNSEGEKSSSVTPALRPAAPLSPVAAPLPAQEAHWKVGLARVKITPQQPVFMAGYASRDRPFASVHDDLFAKALVLVDEQGSRAALVTTDLIGLTAEIADPIRQRIEEQTGIPAASVLLSSSHTHTGPALSLEAAPREGRTLADAERTVAYTKELQDKLVQVVADAAKQPGPARLSWGVGVVHFVMNRREFTTDRGIILGFNPRGQADRSVPVLRIDGADGNPLAVLFGAASHNTTLGPRDYEISGDYAGHAQRLIEAEQPGVQAMFILGCAGDANPYPRGSHEIAEQHGKELATEVLRVVQDEEKLASVRGTLQVAWGQATLPLASAPPRDELEKLAAGRSGTGPWMAKQMLARLDRGEKLPTQYTCPLSVWQLGDDLTLVALSGEVVVDYVRLLEDALGPGRLWVAAYCHDVYGYLPSARVLSQGGYETRGIYAGGIGIFAPEAEGVLVNAINELSVKAGRPRGKD